MLLTIANIKRSVKDWQYIIIHHSYSPDSKITADWKGIRKYHVSYRIDWNIVSKEEYERRIAIKQGKKFEIPWQDIGYHFGFEYINNTWVLKFGRSLELNGVHTVGFNDRAIGICIIGNFDTQIPSVEQMNAIEELCEMLMKLYDIDAKHILGHRETYALLGKLQQKTCPGMLFPVSQLRERLLQNNFNG